jgi:sulfite reductase subunit B
MVNQRPIPEHLQRVFYKPSLAKVIRVEEMTEKEKLLEISMQDRDLGHLPGQFVQISAFGYGEAPISVCSPPGGETFELCIRRVGNVTAAIHDLEPGDWVGIRGPYGKGFPTHEIQGADLVLVAGGIGLAPLRSLILNALENRDRFNRLILVYGARNPASILFREDIERWRSDPAIEFTVIVDEPDERWTGKTGVVTLPLKDLEFDDNSRKVAVVVGPPVMFKFVTMEFFNKGFNGDDLYFSLERRFRCGIGKCGHCQLNDLYVCQDGPVFSYNSLLGRSEAIEVWAGDED